MSFDTNLTAEHDETKKITYLCSYTSKYSVYNNTAHGTPSAVLAAAALRHQQNMRPRESTGSFLLLHSSNHDLTAIGCFSV